MSARKSAAWLTEGCHVCPAWCDGFHGNDDAYDDRTHQGPTVAVTLTADELAPGEDPGMTRPGAESLPHVNMSLVQHYREESPRIWVGRGGTAQGFYLTTAEAELLASHLGGILQDDRDSQRTAPEREERMERERDERLAE